MNQLTTLFLLAAAVACVTWTVTKEYVFEEFRKYCQQRSAPDCRHILRRKVWYVFTCEYCFSHYVTAALVAATGYHLPIAGWWIDYVLTGFMLVFIANVYMSLYFRLRLSIKLVGSKAKIAEREARER
jgi:hypothetical protein